MAQQSGSHARRLRGFMQKRHYEPSVSYGKEGLLSEAVVRRPRFRVVHVKCKEEGRG
jgi:hypothetical protein